MGKAEHQMTTTFADQLAALRERATKHEGEKYSDHADDPLWAKRAAGDVTAYTIFLVNHAEAIEKVVRLMPSAIARISSEYCSHDGVCSADKETCYVSEFLDALNELEATCSAQKI